MTRANCPECAEEGEICFLKPAETLPPIEEEAQHKREKWLQKLEQENEQMKKDRINQNLRQIRDSLDSECRIISRARRVMDTIENDGDNNRKEGLLKDLEDGVLMRNVDSGIIKTCIGMLRRDIVGNTY